MNIDKEMEDFIRDVVLKDGLNQTMRDGLFVDKVVNRLWSAWKARAALGFTPDWVDYRTGLRDGKNQEKADSYLRSYASFGEAISNLGSKLGVQTGGESPISYHDCIEFLGKISNQVELHQIKTSNLSPSMSAPAEISSSWRLAAIAVQENRQQATIDRLGKQVANLESQINEQDAKDSERYRYLKGTPYSNRAPHISQDICRQYQDWESPPNLNEYPGISDVGLDAAIDAAIKIDLERAQQGKGGAT